MTPMIIKPIHHQRGSVINHHDQSILFVIFNVKKTINKITQNPIPPLVVVFEFAIVQYYFKPLMCSRVIIAYDAKSRSVSSMLSSFTI